MNTSGIRHPSLGTFFGAIGAVMGCLALIVSLSSRADALPSHPLIHRGDIAPGAVTARAIAPGAVRAKALAKGAVTRKALGREAVSAAALGKGAVGAADLADDAVTSRSLAPGSVYGGSLGPMTFHSKTIADLDAVAANPEWTSSNTEAVNCALGERVMLPSFSFTNPGNREVAPLEVHPYSNGDANGVSGQITSNSGGTATAEIGALCLK